MTVEQKLEKCIEFIKKVESDYYCDFDGNCIPRTCREDAWHLLADVDGL